MRKWRSILIMLLVLGGLAGGYYYYDYYQNNNGTLPPRTSSQPAPLEFPVIDIPLNGPVAESEAELSGLAWYGEHLILLPQYPQRLDNQLFALPKDEILAFLAGESSEPLTPLPIPFDASALIDEISGFEGFEAIGFLGDQMLMTVEARGVFSMVGYLASGEIRSDLSDAWLDSTTVAEISPQSKVSNASDETLLIAGNRVMTIYEANGQNLNATPQAHQFDLSLKPLDDISFPNIEYRVTDATSVDVHNRFWVTNYLFPDSIGKLKPAPDALFSAYGVGDTHAKTPTVERLLELQYTETGIELSNRAPIQLELAESSRNWEGIVRLDEEGFLLVTDKFPATMLSFVPYRE